MITLSIDQGTSATKALVIGDGGSILASVEVSIHPRSAPDGSVEQDPDELWQSVVDAGREAVARARVPVDAVGLANQGETVLVWDPRTSSPLTAAISWQDRRSAVVTRRLHDRADELLGLTGLPLDPYFAAPKMAWLREQGESDGVATTTDAWLIRRLTGRTATDAATASRTMLLDLDAVAWSPEAARIFGLEDEELPEIVRNDEVVGETDAFGPRLPLAGVCVDQQAALFADACLGAGSAKCTYGTGAFVLANAGNTPLRSRSGLASSLAWNLEDGPAWCLDGQVYSAGSALRWLEELGLLPAASAADALAESSPPDDRVTFVPGLSGLGAPFWQPAAKGALLGLSLSTSRGSLVRAVLDGIAASVAWLVRAVEDDLGIRLTRVVVDGGLSRSKWLLQAQADLTQVPVDVYPVPHATAVGIAAFTRRALGDREGADRLINGWAPAATFEPAGSPAEASERMARWRDAVDLTVGWQGRTA